MKKSPTHRAALAAALAVCTLAAATPAQTGTNAPETRITVPKPKGDLKGTPITSILTALILSAGIVVITLLPSKRGHQD